LGELHDALTRACDFDEVFLAPELNAFHFARDLRNRLVHGGGLAGPDLKTVWAKARGKGTQANGQQLWTDLAGRAFKPVKAVEPLALGAPEVRATLAVCKRLYDTAEAASLGVLSAKQLGRLVLDEYLLRFPQRRGLSPETLASKVTGFREREHPRLTLLSTAVFEDLLAAQRGS